MIITLLTTKNLKTEIDFGDEWGHFSLSALKKKAAEQLGVKIEQIRKIAVMGKLYEDEAELLGTIFSDSIRAGVLIIKSNQSTPKPQQAVVSSAAVPFIKSRGFIGPQVPSKAHRLASVLDTALKKIPRSLRYEAIDIPSFEAEPSFFIFEPLEFPSLPSLTSMFRDEATYLSSLFETHDPFDSSIRKPSSVRLTPSNTRGILQGEMGLTKSKASQYILASFGASPCVIIAVFNPVTKVAGLAHIDAATNLRQTIGLLSYKLDGSRESPLVTYLATGWMMENSTLTDLQTILSERADEFELKEILQSTSMAINSRTGEVSTNCKHDSMDNGKDVDLRLQCRGLSAQIDIMSNSRRPASVTFNSLSEPEQDFSETSDETLAIVPYFNVHRKSNSRGIDLTPKKPQSCTEFFKQNLQRVFSSPSGPGLYPDK